MRKKTKFFYAVFWYSCAYAFLCFLALDWFQNIPSAAIFMFSLVLMGLSYFLLYKVCLEP